MDVIRDGGRQTRAVQMLVLCTLFWAISFPTMKALNLIQQASVPEGGSWLFAALCVTFRFFFSTLIVLGVTWRSLGRLTRGEVMEGLGLGLFGGGGLLFQVDGLMYTPASTSAFLTQCYAVFIPIWLALVRRQFPSLRIWIACAFVVSGVVVLSDFDWREFRLGRGEWETLIGSVLFTGQILWLERPAYANNNPNHFSLVMFTVMSLVAFGVVLATGHSPSTWALAFRHPASWAFLAILVLVSTMGGYMLMNHWQPSVPATQAGLIYCLEPVFASLFAMFLPAWFAGWAEIQYSNEHLSASLLWGGLLITGANIIVQMPLPVKLRFRTSRRPKTKPD
jgi:drug/metabolite transporter (DMT)-like permease